MSGISFGSSVEINGANLTANIPIYSSDDFTLSFFIMVPGFTKGMNHTFFAALQKTCPALKFQPGWDNDPTVVNISVAEKDYPGLCNHFLRMFQEEGLDVKAMGGHYREPPFLKDVPKPKKLPAALADMSAFKAHVLSLVNDVLMQKDAPQNPRKNPSR